MHEIAVDGNYLSQVDTRVNNWENKDYCCTGIWNPESTFKMKDQTVELIPGARSDVLVKANLTNKTGKIFEACNADKMDETYELRANTYLSGRLDPSTANYVNYVVAYVKIYSTPVTDTNLPNNEEMVGLYPFVDINDNNVKYNQITTFNTDQPKGGNDGDMACNSNKDKTPRYPIGFQVNGHIFDDSQPRLLELSPVPRKPKTKGQVADNRPQTGTDNWEISSADPTRNHVFHIHTNDVQTTRTDPLGNTETLWRDSLLVKYGQPQTILTRYEDFDGKTVLYCHLLSHEDMGMMQVIKFEKLDEGMVGH
ncbi:MAG: multicopper oxidase domain-containing protein [Methylobacter sp.]|nr:multicopper oxidase domain-containing protein [Methylobacter sp.]